MKKLKSIVTSLLCLLMSGSMLLSAGCNGNANNSTNSPTSESSSESSSGSETTETAATAADKTLFMNSMTGMIASFGTNPAQILKISLDLDVKTIAVSESIDAEGNVISRNTYVDSNHTDAAAYFQMQGESILLDAWLNAKMHEKVNEEVESTTYGYADFYIRNDDVYAGATDALEHVPTAEEKAAIEYQKESLTEILQKLQDSLSPSQKDPNEPALPDDSTVIEGEKVTFALTDTSATESGTPEGIFAQLQPLIMKAVTNVFNGLSATVKTEGNVKTLIIDLKKEVENCLTVMKALAESIGEGKTLNDLLTNPQLEGLFNRYLGTLTAEELYQAMQLVLPMMVPGESVSAPAENMSGYQYLVSIIAAMPGNEEGSHLGDTQFGATDKESFLASLQPVEEALKTINSLKFAIQTTDNVFSGIGVDIDIQDQIDLYLALNVETVASHTFKDVTTLKVAQPDVAQ